LQASIKSHAPGCPDCAGQPGCDCGGNCNRCVASEAGCAQGGCAAITTVCQANCNQGGGFCGDGLGNFCTCHGAPSPPTTPAPSPSPPSPGDWIPGSPPNEGLGQCGGTCYRVSNTCGGATGGYSCSDCLVGNCQSCSQLHPGVCQALPAKLTEFCTQAHTKIAFGHGLGSEMQCGDCALIRVKNTDSGAPTEYQEVCIMAIDKGSGEVSDETLLTGADALCKYNSQCRVATRAEYEWKPVDCSACAP